jgi:uncharacterized protein (TIGR03066 family)
MRTYLLSCLLLALVCTSAFGAKSDPSDKELAAKLVGTWTLSPTDPLTKKLSGDITYKSDASYEGLIFIKHSDGTTRWDFTGTWKIEDRKLILTYTKSSVPGVAPVGQVSILPIDHITDKELVTIGDDGQRKTRIRKL